MQTSAHSSSLRSIKHRSVQLNAFLAARLRVRRDVFVTHGPDANHDECCDESGKKDEIRVRRWLN